jgi:hypothetical protein
MHGSQAVVYVHDPAEGSGNLLRREVLSTSLIEGHALACAPLLGRGAYDIVVGWRGGKGGLHLFTPLDPAASKWRDSPIDDGGMACEDVVIADLNGDGKPEIVASGRATHNVKIYWNETPP